MPAAAVLAGFDELVAAGGEDFYPRQQVWQPLNTGSENVSLFVFRDLNGNGRHDPGEGPVVHVAVKLFRPDGSHIVRRSNQHGFANFINFLSIPGVDIGAEGEYRFEVMVPDDWQVTGGNGVQTAQFTARAKTRAGIVADHMPMPVGLAPVLRISGRVVVRRRLITFIAARSSAHSRASASGCSRRANLGEPRHSKGPWFVLPVFGGFQPMQCYDLCRYRFHYSA